MAEEANWERVKGLYKEIYNEKKILYGAQVYKYISQIFQEVRDKYKQEYLNSPRAKKLLAQGKIPDPEQSWKPHKGKALEFIVTDMVAKGIGDLGLSCISDKDLERKAEEIGFGKLYRNVLIRFGKFALLPDADLIIYNPQNWEAIGIVSCKSTLRERIAQTLYWNLKLKSDPYTIHIKCFLVTPDEDGDLLRGLDSNPSRDRIIVEHELDGVYTLRDDIEESEKVKPFPKFFEDLKEVLLEREKRKR